MATLAGKHRAQITSLHVIVLMLNRRCDCRCVMCDIWKSRELPEVSPQEVARLLPQLRELKVRWVVLSGGEPLLCAGLSEICSLLQGAGLRVTLLTTGQRMSELAEMVASRTDETVVSIDGPESIHDAIRRTPGAYRRIARGIRDVRRYRPDYPMSCRMTVQRHNFRYLRHALISAKALGLDSISYLAADTTSSAFNHPHGWSEGHGHAIAIPAADLNEFQEEVDRLIADHSSEIDSGFVRESPPKLNRIVQHFRALAGLEEPEAPQCNAPWISAVVETDGRVRPCFFHKDIGNRGQSSLLEIINGSDGLQFREELDVANNAICKRCVCSLYIKESGLELGSRYLMESN